MTARKNGQKPKEIAERQHRFYIQTSLDFPLVKEAILSSRLPATLNGAAKPKRTSSARSTLVIVTPDFSNRTRMEFSWAYENTKCPVRTGTHSFISSSSEGSSQTIRVRSQEPAGAELYPSEIPAYNRRYLPYAAVL